jgi:aerobic-type carbon monoxide dehydrogenase small subunit (CoxS/CutS family)
MVIDKCLCGAKMVLATNDRGYETYRCSRGCSFYQHDETKIITIEKLEEEKNEKVFTNNAHV